MPADRNHCDLLIVGSGIMGACAARLVRDARPTARILMLDSGPVLGPVAGQRLHDMPDGELRLRYNERVSSGVQGLYVGAADVADDLGGRVAELEPGMYRLSTFGEESSAMPSSALAWNAGGMGVHWTAATPAAWGSEIPDFIDTDEWARDMATASELLHVNTDPLGDSALRTALITALNDVFAGQSAPGREVQPLPMAVNPDADGGKIRSGPNRIFPPRSPRATTRTSSCGRAPRPFACSAREIRCAALSSVMSSPVTSTRSPPPRPSCARMSSAPLNCCSPPGSGRPRSDVTSTNMSSRPVA
ncbi:hypothetical protein OG518_36425 [Streptomyces sp. NBC_01397]|nr:hypothetical protein OG518_36425 [Streptomyces sp. NBC_01397]